MTAGRLVLAGLGLAVATGRFGAQAEPVIYPNGVASCTCINPWGETNFSSDAGTALLATSSCRNAKTSGRNLFSSDLVCLPADHGSSCKKWDKSQKVCSSGAPPPWCETSWCYIDVNNCERPHDFSNVQWPDVTGIPEDGMAYSYETCGNVDSYTAERHYREMSGKHIRVTFPGDSGTGYTLLTHKDGEKKGQKDGSVVQFFRDVAKDANLTWSVKVASNASKSRFSSSFTACVHDIALGETDLCIGNFWATTERRKISSFTPLMYDDNFRLVVPMSKEKSYTLMMLTPFAPFSWAAWQLILALVLYMSVALLIISPVERDRMVQEEEEGGLTVLEHIASLFFITVRNHAALRWIDTHMTFVVKSFYFGMMSFTSGTPVVETATFPGRMVTAGFAMFGLIMLTAYTASSAAALVATAGGGAIRNLADVEASGKLLCVQTAMMSVFNTRYPQLTEKILPGVNAPELFDALKNGKCCAIVLAADMWQREMVKNGDRHCDKAMTGETLLSIGNGMPIADEIQLSFSYLMQKRIQTGGYFELAKSYKKQYVGEASCPVDEEKEPVTDGFQSLDEWDLFAPFLFTFVCTSGGLASFFIFGYVGIYFKSDKFFMNKFDATLRKELPKLALTELRTRAMGLCGPSAKYEEPPLDAEQVNGAFNRGPDKSALVELIFNAECSLVRQDVLQLQESSVSELIKRATVQNIDATKIGVAAANSNPKAELIELIVGDLDVDGDGDVTDQEFQSKNEEGEEGTAL